MSTFLALVQQFYKYEVGFSGAAPTTVVNQQNQRGKAVYFIAEADYQIQTRWLDWDFMWEQWSRATEVGTATYSAPTDLRTFDKESFWLDYTTDSAQNLDYLPYKVWRRHFGDGSKTNALPDQYTVKPDGTVLLESPPDAIYTLTADYWKKAVKMTADTDTSNIPVDFERIILARAKMMYAEHFKDPEMLRTSAPEYGSMLKKLESSELPERNDRESQSIGDPIMVI